MIRPKLGIVIGLLDQPRLVQGFELLSDLFEISYFAIDHANLTSAFNITSKLYIFENLADMPGYMRGLEDHLQNMDLLIGIESSRLPTFQMVRTAAKHKIPALVLTTEVHPFLYANYPNIRAIQTDVFENAQGFLTLTDLAANMLKVEGIGEAKIHKTLAFVDSDRFKPNEKVRQRFRDYLGISAEDRLIVYHGPLERKLNLKEMIAAFRVLSATNPYQKHTFKLLFVGNGDAAKDLKYYCHDFHTGNAVLFLHQNPEPFLADLYAASDIRLYCSGDDSQTFPLDLLESTCCGVVPVYQANAQIAEILGGSGISVPYAAMPDWLSALQQLLDIPGALERRKQQCAELATSKFSATSWRNQMLDCLKFFITNEIALPNITSSQISLANIESLLTSGRTQEAMSRLEAAIAFIPGATKEKSELMRLKGDLLMENGSLDESTTAYEESLQADESNFRAYRGLGYLAFKGHAHEDAIFFFRKALAKNRDDGLSLLGVGLVHRRLGLNEDALYWLERSADVDGMSKRLTTAMIQTCLECHATQKSIATLERVMDTREPSANLLMTLGQLYLRSGNTTKAATLMQQARSIEEEQQLKQVV